MGVDFETFGLGAEYAGSQGPNSKLPNESCSAILQATRRHSVVSAATVNRSRDAGSRPTTGRSLWVLKELVSSRRRACPLPLGVLSARLLNIQTMAAKAATSITAPTIAQAKATLEVSSPCQAEVVLIGSALAAAWFAAPDLVVGAAGDGPPGFAAGIALDANFVTGSGPVLPFAVEPMATFGPEIDFLSPGGASRGFATGSAR